MQSDFQLRQIPPQAIDAEGSLLSTCLVDRESIDNIVDMLCPEHFYRTAHQKIFKAVQDIHKAGDPVDLVTVANKLRDTGGLEAVGGATYLSSLVDEVPLAVNAEKYALIIKQKYALRKVVELSNSTIQTCLESQDLEGAIEKITSGIEKITDETINNKSVVRIGDLLPGRIDEYESYKANKGQVRGIPTGLIELDSITTGLQGGDLIIIAGRPSMGKTALAMNIAGHAAEHKHPVAIFSYEQPKEQLTDRQITSISRIDSRAIKSGYMNMEQWKRVVDACGKINDWPMFIEDRGNLSINELTHNLYQLWKKEGIKLAIVDYLQLMPFPGVNRLDIEIGHVTKSLKSTAKKLNIPIILLSQLNRKVEERSVKKPLLSDLRESGNIEQDADVIMFIYRDEVYNQGDDNPNKGIAELNIAKQRNGPTGMIKLKWLDFATRFENLVRGTYDQNYN